MEEITICSFDDLEKLKIFINEIWSKNHVLATNQKLLDFQHKAINKYNFIISKNPNNEITALLGFIPTSQYDENLKDHADIWLAIWKVNEISAKPGIGFALLKWLEKNMKPQSIGAIGINKEVKKIYDVLGYETGVLKQYFFLNPFIKEFKIAKSITQSRREFISSSSFLKEITFEEINDLKFQNSPFKSLKYLENRYLKHPYYKYFLIGSYQNDTLNAVLILRKIEANGSSCLRIVDILGDYSKIGNISSSLVDLLQEYNSEYIDCLNHGISEQMFLDWGFNLRNSESIIPNYFEPFLCENVDILFAYKSKRSDYIIFKGDSDQDRPNILK